MITRLFYTLLLLFTSSGLVAREYSYLHFQAKDGLPGNNIYGITQDQDGFIWIATETGLSRFDGKTFKNFTVKDGLPGNEVYALFTDHKNRVWILPFKKEICYYYKGRIYNKHNSRLVAQIPVRSEAKSVCEDAAGRLIISSIECNILVGPDDSVRAFRSRPGDQETFMPVASVGGALTEIVPPSMLFGHVHPFSLIRNIHPAAEPALYTLLSDNETAIVYFGGKKVVTFSIPRHNTAYLVRDIFYTINTSSGCHIYDIRTGHLLETLLPGIDINAAFIDDESGTWIGGAGSGLYYFPPGKTPAVTHNPEKGPLQVKNFYRSGGNLVISTADFCLWKINLKNPAPAKRVYPQDIAPGDILLPEGNIFKPNNDQINIVLKIPDIRTNSLSASDSKLIKSIDLAGDSTLITTHKCLLVTSKSTATSRVAWSTRATCALMIKDQIFTGDLNGLYYFPSNSPVVFNPQNARCLAKGVFVSLAWSRSNNLLWAITSDNGVYCFRDNKLIRNFNESNGLSANICKCIFTDGRRVFIGTNNGLNVIDPDSNFTIRQYYTLDGLISNDINCVYAEGDNIWAGTPEGYSVLDQSRLPPPGICRLALTDITVSGKSLPADTIGLQLDPRDNNIAFRFSGLSFRSMGKIIYHYRLSGLGNEWQTTGDQALQYPSLPAGDYRLELYAVNRFGIRSKTILVPFTIGQHWWTYLWVQFAGLLLLVCLIIFALLRRAARVRMRDREKSELKAKIVELEQMALRAQMNPHFIFNSLNSFYQYVINRDLAGASKFMNDFSTLIRLLFEITALKEIPLDKEIHFLTTYMNLEQTKLNHSFTFTFHIQPDIITEHISIPTFILQPFIENGIRHGVANLKDRQGTIDIHITMDNAGIRVSIEDNGPGRAYTKAQKNRQASIHHSRGIALTEERIALYNETRHTNISIETVDKYHKEIPAGTLVNIYFPVKNKL